MVECRSELPGFSTPPDFFDREPDLPTFDEWLYDHTYSIEEDVALDTLTNELDLDMLVELVKEHYKVTTTEDDVGDWLWDNQNATELYLKCIEEQGGSGIYFQAGSMIVQYLEKTNAEEFYL